MPEIGYEIFGFNPDGTAVLLGDEGIYAYSDFEEAAVTAFRHLVEMIADAEEETHE